MGPLIVFLMFLVPFAYYIVANIQEARRVSTIFEYFFYGRDFTPRKFAATLVATNAGLSGAFYLILIYGMLYGLWVFPWVWAFWFLTQKASEMVISRTESVTASTGGWIGRYGGLHDFIGTQFDSTAARRAAGVLSVLAYAGLIACEIILAYEIVRAVLPGGGPVLEGSRYTAHASIATLAIVIGIFAYTAAAGFRGVIRTDLFQLALMSLMVVCVALFAVPSLAERWPEYVTRFETGIVGLVNPDRGGMGEFLSFLIANLVFWGLWWPGAQDQWQRCAATKSAGESLHWLWGTTGVVPSMYFGAISAVFVAAGAALASLSDGGLSISPGSLGRLIGVAAERWGGLSSIAGALGAGIIGSGLLSASMSTIDTYLNVASLSLYGDSLRARSADSVEELERQDVEGGHHLAGARATSILFLLPVLLIVWFCSRVSDVYEIIYFSFSFMFALLPALAFALFGLGKKVGGKAVTASLLFGGVVCVAGYATIIPRLEVAIASGQSTDDLYSWMYWWPILTALAGGLVLLCALGWSLATRPRKNANG